MQASRSVCLPSRIRSSIAAVRRSSARSQGFCAAANSTQAQTTMAHANHNVVLVLDYGERRRRGSTAIDARTQPNSVAFMQQSSLHPSPSPAASQPDWTGAWCSPVQQLHAEPTPCHAVFPLAGSQYTQLIARRIREIGMLSILFPGDASMVRHSAAAFSSRAGARLSSHVCCAQHAQSAHTPRPLLAAQPSAAGSPSPYRQLCPAWPLTLHPRAPC